MGIFQKLDNTSSNSPTHANVRPVQYEEMKEFIDKLILLLIRKLHKLKSMEIGM